MSSRTASLNLDQQLFTIWCAVSRKVPAGWYVPERADQDMTRAATIRDIRAGQVEDVVAVIEFNPAEHTCSDVTADIAIEIANGLDAGEPISPELHEFIAAHAGLDYARGLRKFDRAFAAA